MSIPRFALVGASSWLLAAGVWLGASASQQGAAKEDPGIASARERYRAASWPKGNLRAGLRLAELGLPGFAGERLDARPGLPVNRRFVDSSGRPAFGIEMSVGDSLEEAQRVLLGHLAAHSSAEPVPSAQSSGLPVGEIGYVGFSGAGAGRILWIAFVRGNVAIRLSCFDPALDPHPDMAGITQAIDASIRRMPVLAPGAGVPHPAIRKFSAAKTDIVAGENVLLELDVLDPAGGEAEIDWIAGGPGQGYVERDKAGQWMLHTTGPGSMTLTVHVVGSTGTSSTASVQLEIADD